MRKWNFCAGPAVISEEVLEEVQSELLLNIMILVLPLWN